MIRLAVMDVYPVDTADVTPRSPARQVTRSHTGTWQDLLETRSTTGSGYHSCSRIAFDESGPMHSG